MVAIYDRGLGFGDFTLPRGTLDGHLTDPLDHAVLVRIAGDAAPAEVDTALAGLPYAGLAVLDRAGFQAGTGRSDDAGRLGELPAGRRPARLRRDPRPPTAWSWARTHAPGSWRCCACSGPPHGRCCGCCAGRRGGGATATAIGAMIAGVALVMLNVGLTGSPTPYVPPLAGAALLGRGGGGWG